MPFEQADLPSVLGIPHDHVAVGVRRSEITVVGRERHRLARAILERIAGRERGGVPEADEPVQPGGRDNIALG